MNGIRVRPARLRWAARGREEVPRNGATIFRSSCLARMTRCSLRSGSPNTSQCILHLNGVTVRPVGVEPGGASDLRRHPVPCRPCGVWPARVAHRQQHGLWPHRPDAGAAAVPAHAHRLVASSVVYYRGCRHLAPGATRQRRQALQGVDGTMNSTKLERSNQPWHTPRDSSDW